MKKIKIFFLILIIPFFTYCSKEYLLEVHIIDVGQGDSILIKTPDSHNILVDGGDADSFNIVKSYLRRNKVKSIDAIVATHTHSDHIGSLNDVINNFDVEYLFMPEETSDNPSYEDLIKSCNDNNVKINYLYKGDSAQIGDIYVTVLSPSYISENSNHNSIVFKLDYKNKSFLFTGDAEATNEIDIIDSFYLDDVNFLKVSHHGSSSSTTEDFLEATTPDVAVISCGYKNQYGHPHQSTLDNLSQNDILTYRTDLSGNMVFYSDGDIIFTRKKYESN